MKWRDLVDPIAKLAPLLGTAIGGPAGGAVGAVISSALGVEDKPEAVLEAIKADPNAAIKLMEIQENNKVELEKAIIQGGIKHHELDVENVAGARNRDMQLKLAGHNNYRADIMIFIAFASFCFLAYLINSNTDLKPQVLAIFNMAIGALLKMLGDAFQFEFGSSRSSRVKDLRP